MKKILFYDKPLAGVKGFNDIKKAAAFLSGYDIVVIHRYTPSIPAEEATFESDIAVLDYLFEINPNVQVGILIDAATWTANKVDGIRTDYQSRVSWIAVQNMNYAGSVTRQRQIDVLNDIRENSLKAILLCDLYDDVIASKKDDTYNPSGTGLPISPQDIVISVVDVPNMSVDSYIYNELIGAAKNYNNNRKFGALYSYPDDNTYNAADFQRLCDLSAFWRHDYIAVGVAETYVSGSAVKLQPMKSPHETPSNVTHALIADRKIARSDGIVLSFTGSTITTGSIDKP